MAHSSPYVNKLIKLTNKSEKEVTAAWKKAQELTADNFGMTIDDFERRQFEYALETAKDILGLKEGSYIREFYDSQKTAKDYIDEVMTSSSIDVDLDHVSMRRKKYIGTEMDDEDEERQSKEYDSVDAFNEPDSQTGEFGDDSGSNPDPDYEEDDRH